jgi:RNA polymerase sigma-70 factor (ECF subfamily)
MRSLATESDDKLLRLMLEGDQEAFTALYRRRQSGIYQFALHMSGSAATAEDITQEVFVALIDQAERYDPGKGSLASYLYGVARHKLLHRQQRERLLVPIDSEESDSDISSNDADPLGDLTRREAIEAVRSAVLSLPPHYREAVILCDLQELGYDEAAKALGCPVGTVRSRLHRGRIMLVDRLKKKGEVDDLSAEASSARCFA